MNSTAELFAAIQDNTDQKFPRQELAYLIAHPEESIPLLLDLLTDVIENFDGYYENQDFIGHIYAFFLLAQFREKRAYPLIAQFFIRHGDRAERMCSDFATEDLARVLASLFDGDLTPIKQLVENSEVNEWVRGTSVRSLTILVLHDIVPRDEVIAYFRELFTDKLERAYAEVWNGLAVETMRLHPEELQDEVRQAFANGFADEGVIGLSAIEQALVANQEAHVAELHKDRHYALITDTIAEMEWWAAFRPPPAKRMSKPTKFIAQTVGRNLPCHCGSGKKYKKCCWPN